MFNIDVYEGKTNTTKDYFDIAKIVLDEQKTQGYQGGYGVFTDSAYGVKSMMEKFCKKREYGNEPNCAFHIIITFSYIPSYVTIDDLYEYMEHVSDILGLNHQNVYGIHHNNFEIETESLEIHMLLNAVTWKSKSYSMGTVLPKEFAITYIAGTLYQAAAYMTNPMLDTISALSYSDSCFDEIRK